MKKKRKIKKKKKIKKKRVKRRFFKKNKKTRLKKKKRRKSFKAKSKKKQKRNKAKEFFRKIVRLGSNLKPKIKFDLNIDKKIQNFFQGIANKIDDFKDVIEEERAKRKKERLKTIQKERSEEAKKNKIKQLQQLKFKQDEIKEEKKIERERKVDLKRFIREEQAKLRSERAARQRAFLEKIRLEKKIEEFRKREALEIKKLEKFVLKQEREDYSEVQERINQIKQKYQAIRDQKIRERIEQLGIQVSETDSRSDLLEKERLFNLEREKIENTLESFYRSMASCVFQLNRRWLPKKMSLLRVIDNRYETSEIFIKSDEEADENWLMLVYLKNNDPNSKIVVEDKTDENKNSSIEYNSNEIFTFSDNLVDSLTAMIDRKFKTKSY